MRPTARPRLWISPAGAISPTHYDEPPSFLAQVHGTKRMLLWPPGQLPALYPYPTTSLLRRRAQVDVTNPDLKRFPRFNDTWALEAILKPGDVLFFPGYWPHYTESQTLSISCSARFDTEEQVQKRKKMTSRRLLMPFTSCFATQS